MPNFTPKPPVYEAREFAGGAASALDIQGWLLAQNIDSQRVNPNTETEKITFGSQTISVGQWLIFKDDAFVVMKASDFYKQYARV